jgi:hypothetical protein
MCCLLPTLSAVEYTMPLLRTIILAILVLPFGRGWAWSSLRSIISGVAENLSRHTDDELDKLSASHIDRQYTHSQIMLSTLAKMSYTERDLS